MQRLINPVVAITRPQPDGERFLEELLKTTDRFEPCLSPAFKFDRTDVAVPEFESAIFTSKRGVMYAPKGDGRTAYCVGRTTAAAARRNGYVTQSADGNADDLVAMILAASPSNSMLHIRGENSAGNVSQRLVDGGLNSDVCRIYRKVDMPPTESLITHLDSHRPVIFSVFSAETVSILGDWRLDFAAAHFVAISGQVAAVTRDLQPARVVVADGPNMAAMTRTMAALIA